ncbi:aromatic hydrocarbon degradation protein [Halomonas sp. 22501_18_FS]|uniref:Aromatic hydrocarbon degradation protein n=3 Tax=Pseudomonadota TaxID=1224 RepID=A0A9X5B4Y1_9GAMM|nr:aromatic hydrocarbon degradation protein [Halospina sp. K52047b]MYL25617.1 aromatic hydrocarbon degradation protein [Halomonas utahensis]MYL74853.1 aromatic hydrocarbon degradation protein [Halomonas sp. 22501_18_FS]
MAMAGGFSLNEQSASAMGTANAGAAANPQNASTVIFNPAGMTQLSGTNLSFGAAVLDIDAEADSASATNQVGEPVRGSNGGDIADPAYLPNAFLTHEMSDNVAVGIGLHAPYGLAADYDDDFKGRYFADETELTGIALTPSIAVDSGNGLSLGFGVNVMYLDGKLSKFTDTSGATLQDSSNGFNTPAAATRAASATPTYSNVEGDSIEYTLRIGAMYELSDKTQFGLTVESGTEASLDGDITISDFPTQAGPVTLKEDAEVPLDIPPSVTFGARHQLNDDVTLLFGATWARWSDFEELDIYSGEGGTGEVSSALRAQGQVGNPITHITEKWQDTWQYNLGASWQADPQWKLRAGYAWDESPVDSYTTARIPSQDRHWLTLGAQFAPANTDWTVDAAVGTLIFDGDAKVDEQNYTHATPQQSPAADQSRYQGSYDLSAWSASVELSRSF